jgi:hypothetical protein
MVKYDVLFEVRTEFLYAVKTCVGFKGLNKLKVVPDIIRNHLQDSFASQPRSFLVTQILVLLIHRIQ